jgi:sodium pump decarboxylase gamma subunit
MLSQGILLMIAGMGTVFVFLALMVLVMQAVGKFFIINEARFRVAAPAPAARKTADSSETELIAAIIAAVKAHSSK